MTERQSPPTTQLRADALVSLAPPQGGSDCTVNVPKGSARFSGVLAPVVTPFSADYSPQQGMFNRYCRWLVGQGADLAVFGTNSEANSLSLVEKRALLDGLLGDPQDAGAGAGARVEGRHLMPGTGHCSFTEAAELSRHAVEAGCRGVLMLPPFYYKGVSDEGLFRFYSEVIQRVGDSRLALYLYNYPQMSQTPLSVDLVERLVTAYPDTVVGVKDSSGDWGHLSAMLERQWPDFRVFCGSESMLLQTLRAGGAGCISATANVNPAAIRRLCDTWRDGSGGSGDSNRSNKNKDADEQQRQLDVIRGIFQAMPMIPALKAATARYTGDDGWLRLRPPLLPLTEAQQADLYQRLDKASFRIEVDDN